MRFSKENVLAEIREKKKDQEELASIYEADGAWNTAEGCKRSSAVLGQLEEAVMGMEGDTE